ncbi:unnamed protein product [Fraxinus pennsylvanica]|uniref:AT1G17665-like protein n=1 Tax=Fraxinus pennsylvanica TaxID=56036 RepID=A0AAD1ZFJ3_9LAMI|nr:unnamed protein product [Fraxinus pennsylvanica]
MAANPFLLPIIYSSSSSSSNYSSSPMFPLLFSFFILFLSLFILIFSLYTFKNIRNNNHNNAHQIHGQAQKIPSLHVNNSEVDRNNSIQEPDPVNLTSSLLLEILPSSSAKWDNLFSGENEICDDTNGSGQEEKKRKKKRAKKKRPDPDDEAKKEVDGLVCLCPFTKSSSATQRKIKLQYDQLVKSHESNALTPSQVGQFVTCLIEVKDELHHKSEVVKRKFTITKALLCKADRSSFDRLCQQIFKLQLEQKRLEEDAFVYNWLQQKIKHLPAYKKMLELGACMDMKANSGELVENTDADLSDISFEELLAQEKKDVFWQRNGRFKACTG